MKTAVIDKYENLPEPPMPEGHWFFGNIKPVIKHPLNYYYQVRKEFGNVVKMRALFGMQWYLVTSPEGTERILQTNQANYRKPALVRKALGLVTGNGLVVSEGDFWRRQRRLMQPAFHRQRLFALGETMITQTERMLARWEKTFARTGEAFDITGEMTDLTVRIAAQTLFSSDLSEAESERFARAMRAGFEYVGYRLLHPLAIPEFVPTPRNLRFKKARKVLDEVVRRIIEERRRAPDADKNDLLAMLMSARDEETGEMMDEKQLKDEVMTLLIAGHETTAATLAWTWYLLAKNPSKA
ncbi:MAG TPA: cytochrome P450, partial [Pyrinomonadaceae bacterium]|nr:cytochrome P450 [Pyrinomonadaceae bacterium]